MSRRTKGKQKDANLSRKRRQTEKKKNLLRHLARVTLRIRRNSLRKTLLRKIERSKGLEKLESSPGERLTRTYSSRQKGILVQLISRVSTDIYSHPSLFSSRSVSSLLSSSAMLGAEISSLRRSRRKAYEKTSILQGDEWTTIRALAIIWTDCDSRRWNDQRKIQLACALANPDSPSNFAQLAHSK